MTESIPVEHHVSTPGLLFRSAAGTQHSSNKITIPVSSLVGKEYFGIFPGVEGILAACKDGLYCVASPKSGADQIDLESGTDPAHLSSIRFKSSSNGKGFIIGIDESGQVYSWGSQGQHGQLGLGACVQKSIDPSKIIHSSRFTVVQSGEAFSMALDDRGGVYSWGENFDRQLGLYTKNKSSMHLANAMIEDMSFTPRLLPISVKQKIIKISCGSRFSMAINKNGQLFSWGAGECGQLGTGRCTKRELPEIVHFSTNDHHNDTTDDAANSNIKVLDIACGAAHAIAIVSLGATINTNEESLTDHEEKGILYSWGLNKSAQLGLGDSTTRHFPAPVRHFFGSIPDSEEENLCVLEIKDETPLLHLKVFAEGHSTASIDARGRLFTWGSTAHDRLMQKLPLRAPERDKQLVEDASATRRKLIVDTATTAAESLRRRAAEVAAIAAETVAESKLKPMAAISRPTIVQSPHLDGSRISSFAFSRTASVALIMTTVEGVHPCEGPKRSFSRLEIFGVGFWDAPSIIVKFSFKGAPPDGGLAADARSSEESSTAALMLAAGLNPPRSCAAKFVSPRKLVCKPPKFAEVGVYSVSVSMDGVNFLASDSQVVIHKEVSIISQKPELFNLKTLLEDSLHPSNAVIPELLLGVKGLNPAKQPQGREYFVRMQFTKLTGNGVPPADTRSSAHAVVLSTQQQQQMQHTIAVDVVAKGRLIEERNHPTPVKNGAGAAPSEAIDDDLCMICCENVDLALLVEYYRSSSVAVLLEMRSAVSLNGQDFSAFKPTGMQNNLHSTVHKAATTTAGSVDDHGGADSNGKPTDGSQHQQHIEAHNISAVATPSVYPSTLMYNFAPSIVKPCCISIAQLLTNLPAASAAVFSSSSGSSRRSAAEAVRMDQLQRVTAAEIAVTGSSFLPAARLPKGFTIEAHLRPILDGAVVTRNGSVLTLTETAISNTSRLTLSVRCDTVNKLSMGISLAQISALQQIIDRVLGSASADRNDNESDASEVELNYLPFSISFLLKSPAVEGGEQVIHPGAAATALSVNLYNSQLQCVVPSCIRRFSDVSSRVAILLSKTGFHFISADMKVFLHFPKGTDSENEFYPPIPLPALSVQMLQIPSLKLTPTVVDEEGADGGDGVASDELLPPAAAIATRYWVEVVLKPLSTYLPQLLAAQTATRSAAPNGVSLSVEDTTFSPPFICLSVSLDGKSIEPRSSWSKLSFFSSLATYSIATPNPKGGFAAGSSITLELEEYCPSIDAEAVRPIVSIEAAEIAAAADDREEVDLVTQQQKETETPPATTPPQPQRCMVRIRGAATGAAPDGAVVLCEARTEDTEISEEADTDGRGGRKNHPVYKTLVTFTLPSGVTATAGMTAVRTQGKDKFYFLDVSMDGGLTFDLSQEALLAIK